MYIHTYIYIYIIYIYIWIHMDFISLCDFLGYPEGDFEGHIPDLPSVTVIFLAAAALGSFKASWINPLFIVINYCMYVMDVMDVMDVNYIHVIYVTLLTTNTWKQ